MPLTFRHCKLVLLFRGHQQSNTFNLAVERQWFGVTSSSGKTESSWLTPANGYAVRNRYADPSPTRSVWSTADGYSRFKFKVVIAWAPSPRRSPIWFRSASHAPFGALPMRPSQHWDRSDGVWHCPQAAMNVENRQKYPLQRLRGRPPRVLLPYRGVGVGSGEWGVGSGEWGVPAPGRGHSRSSHHVA